MHPTMLPADSPLAKIEGVYNAIQLVGDAVGDVVLVGVAFDDTATDDEIYDQCEQVVGAVCDPDDELEGVAIAPFTRYI